MGYNEDDQLAINTIRLLAVSYEDPTLRLWKSLNAILQPSRVSERSWTPRG